VTPVSPAHANPTLDVHHLGNATIWTQTTHCFTLAACAILDYMEMESRAALSVLLERFRALVQHQLQVAYSAPTPRPIATVPVVTVMQGTATMEPSV